MARLSDGGPATRALGAVILGCESLIVFLGGLVVYGLKVLPNEMEPWWGIIAGCVVAVLLIGTIFALPSPVGIVLGWAWQVLIALSGFLVPALFIVALIFGGLWGYATIKGMQLDRRNRAPRAAAAPNEKEEQS